LHLRAHPRQGLAKAKVAGSNPVFRSTLPGLRAFGGSGLLHGLRLSWRRRLFTTVALSAGSSTRTGPLADRSDAIRQGGLEEGWNICDRLAELTMIG